MINMAKEQQKILNEVKNIEIVEKQMDNPQPLS